MSDSMDTLYQKYSSRLFSAVQYTPTSDEAENRDVFNRFWNQPFDAYLEEIQGPKSEVKAQTNLALDKLNTLLDGKGALFIDSQKFTANYRSTMGDIILNSTKKEKISPSTKALFIFGATIGVGSLLALYAACQILTTSINKGVEKIKDTKQVEVQKAPQPKPENTQSAASRTQTQSVTPSAQKQTKQVTPEPVQPQKTTTVQRGPIIRPAITANRPVKGEWYGSSVYMDRSTKLSQAFDTVLDAEFNHALAYMKKNVTPYQNFYDASVIDNRVKGSNITLEFTDGRPPMQFYVNNVVAYKNDIECYRRNLWDVTNDLSTEQQILAMESIGPSMGLPIDAQRKWQDENGKESRRALDAITMNAEDLMAQYQDMTSFEAVMHATRLYDQKHPGNKALLLTAAKTIQQIERLSEYAYNNAMKASDRQIPKSHYEPKFPKKFGTTSHNSQSDKGSGLPWGWIVAGAVVGGVLLKNKLKKRRGSR